MLRRGRLLLGASDRSPAAELLRAERPIPVGRVLAVSGEALVFTGDAGDSFLAASRAGQWDGEGFDAVERVMGGEIECFEWPGVCARRFPGRTIVQAEVRSKGRDQEVHCVFSDGSLFRSHLWLSPRPPRAAPGFTTASRKPPKGRLERALFVGECSCLGIWSDCESSSLVRLSRSWAEDTVAVESCFDLEPGVSVSGAWTWREKDRGVDALDGAGNRGKAPVTWFLAATSAGAMVFKFSSDLDLVDVQRLPVPRADAVDFDPVTRELLFLCGPELWKLELAPLLDGEPGQEVCFGTSGPEAFFPERAAVFDRVPRKDFDDDEDKVLERLGFRERGFDAIGRGPGVEQAADRSGNKSGDAQVGATAGSGGQNLLTSLPGGGVQGPITHSPRSPGSPRSSGSRGSSLCQPADSTTAHTRRTARGLRVVGDLVFLIDHFTGVAAVYERRLGALIGVEPLSSKEKGCFLSLIGTSSSDSGGQEPEPEGLIFHCTGDTLSAIPLLQCRPPTLQSLASAQSLLSKFFGECNNENDASKAVQGYLKGIYDILSFPSDGYRPFLAGIVDPSSAAESWEGTHATRCLADRAFEISSSLPSFPEEALAVYSLRAPHLGFLPSLLVFVQAMSPRESRSPWVQESCRPRFSVQQILQALSSLLDLLEDFSSDVWFVFEWRIREFLLTTAALGLIWRCPAALCWLSAANLRSRVLTLRLDRRGFADSELMGQITVSTLGEAISRATSLKTGEKAQGCPPWCKGALQLATALSATIFRNQLLALDSQIANASVLDAVQSWGREEEISGRPRANTVSGKSSINQGDGRECGGPNMVSSSGNERDCKDGGEYEDALLKIPQELLQALEERTGSEAEADPRQLPDKEQEGQKWQSRQRRLFTEQAPVGEVYALAELDTLVRAYTGARYRSSSLNSYRMLLSQTFRASRVAVEVALELCSGLDAAINAALQQLGSKAGQWLSARAGASVASCVIQAGTLRGISAEETETLLLQVHAPSCQAFAREFGTTVSNVLEEAQRREKEAEGDAPAAEGSRRRDSAGAGAGVRAALAGGAARRLSGASTRTASSVDGWTSGSHVRRFSGTPFSDEWLSSLEEACLSGGQPAPLGAEVKQVRKAVYGLLGVQLRAVFVAASELGLELEGGGDTREGESVTGPKGPRPADAAGTASEKRNQDRGPEHSQERTGGRKVLISGWDGSELDPQSTTRAHRAAEGEADAGMARVLAASASSPARPHASVIPQFRESVVDYCKAVPPFLSEADYVHLMMQNSKSLAAVTEKLLERSKHAAFESAESLAGTDGSSCASRSSHPEAGASMFEAAGADRGGLCGERRAPPLQPWERCSARGTLSQYALRGMAGGHGGEGESKGVRGGTAYSGLSGHDDRGGAGALRTPLEAPSSPGSQQASQRHVPSTLFRLLTEDQKAKAQRWAGSQATRSVTKRTGCSRTLQGLLDRAPLLEDWSGLQVALAAEQAGAVFPTGSQFWTEQKSVFELLGKEQRGLRRQGHRSDAGESGAPQTLSLPKTSLSSENSESALTRELYAHALGILAVGDNGLQAMATHLRGVGLPAAAEAADELHRACREACSLYLLTQEQPSADGLCEFLAARLPACPPARAASPRRLSESQAAAQPHRLDRCMCDLLPHLAVASIVQRVAPVCIALGEPPGPPLRAPPAPGGSNPWLAPAVMRLVRFGHALLCSL